jgi:filamentous hemagglutinin family protein
VGGSVAQGAATISGNTNSTTVTQSSSRAVINWQSFDVGSGKSVVFNQPDAKSATLNRVTGSTTSTIAGQITSNGAVYLINPNGIAITSTGTVNTAGGFVASTLDIADADFMAGKLNFAGNGASNAVTNAGHIATSQGAYVALLGGAVSNSGTINVPYGKVGLGSGESIALDLNGNGFMQVAVPTAVLTGSNALIDNSGSISASGGYVQLQAAVVKDAVRNVINMSGSINADSATGDGGTIHLIGGADTASMGGKVTVSGTLSAQATGDTGNGGSIETSGALVNFAGLNVNAASAHGKAGTWLLDPTDLTIDDTAATTINTALATTNVTLQTTATTATGAGVQSVGNGDIIVNSALAWDSTSTLSLAAYNNITINAAVSAPTGGLTLTAGNSVANTGAITDTASLNIGTFNLTNGNWSQNTATLPSFSATDFRFNPATATFLRVVGGDGATATPYQIADVYGLQGIASGTLQTSNVVLVNNIDAIGTSRWNAGAGFVPIGTDGAGNGWDGTAYTVAGLNGFSGVFNGNGFVVSNLFINRSSTVYQGLLGVLTGSIGSLGLTNVNVTGGADTGGLVGATGTTGGNINKSYAVGTVTGTAYYTGGLVGHQGSGTVSESYTMGTVSGLNNTGGLVGASDGGSIANSYSGATVSATGSYVGGLIGTVGSGSIAASYATGNVSTTLAGGSGYAGGLIGYYVSASTINAVYATGKVTSSTQYSGGLIGYMAAGALTNGTASGAVSGTTYVGGIIGFFASAGSVSTSSATGNVTATGNYAGGLIGVMSAGLASSSTASGTVKGVSALGGLVGSLSGAASIGASSASGAVTGTGTIIGGLVGNATGTGTISASFATGSVSGPSRVGGLFGQ